MECLVYEGWLVKSPPEKRIVKAKWRQRWFVLRHSGLLPGQFFLEYFTDNTCKKLKGRIELDQCEQVDAGISFEGKRTNYQHMFDIRTPKRIYYLVAETEAEMNKWVECICSVCNLKIHMEEDFLVPQDPNSSNNNVVTTEPTSTSLSQSKNSSNPYIPISECHTGKPILNGITNDISGQVNQFQNSSVDRFGCVDLPREPPPPPPKTDLLALPCSLPDEFYDHPKPLGTTSYNLNTSTSDTDVDDSYKVPVQCRTDAVHAYNNDVFSTLPPKVNWNTYPENQSPNCSTVPRRKSSNKEDINVYDVVPSFHGSIKDIKPQPKKVQTLASQFENLNVKASFDDSNSLSENDSIYMNQTSNVPPRPPKPSKLRERPRYENFEPLQVHKEGKHNYDVPPPSKDLNIESAVPINGSDVCENSPNGSIITKEATMDDTYDFPKFRSEDNINAPVPLTQNTGTAQRTRRHAYTNAPPGLFNSKDLIFNYEYRPSLITSDGYLSSDAVRSIQSGSDTATPPSPSAIGAYANVPTSPSLVSAFQSETPPLVNRELKPKRNFSNEERGSFSFLTLQPPPVCRSRTKADKRSFRKTRAAPSPTPLSSLNGMPPVPNRFRHHPEISATSDDEISNSSGSRRNSANDDQARHVFPLPAKKEEIQYLDLDLDSEPSPSPKTPERLSASTVYKKVDFVKTKVFNEMRQNVEESYRKSQ